MSKHLTWRLALAGAVACLAVVLCAVSGASPAAIALLAVLLQADICTLFLHTVRSHSRANATLIESLQAQVDVSAAQQDASALALRQTEVVRREFVGNVSHELRTLVASLNLRFD